MSTIDQNEWEPQQRVVKLFCDTLGYDYLGNWIDREDTPPYSVRTKLSM